ncbi:hypothetical protein JCGZ_03799 [Jatropha curcas]|uniref:Aminotransferase-like plant mobile domain-containing protein n=1 Tax=Jatropha curcas TaxID=180498 RepID=A0A067JCL0_JATCU|nr:hypothetical protein JCGZ_03799 [Jatropha curcas]
MAVENVADWLPRGAVLDPVTQPKIVKSGKSGGNVYAAGEWFDRLLVRVQNHVWEAGFDYFFNMLPREMPLERVEEMDVDVVARAFLFYPLSTTLFTNHGNDADLALLPPLQDLDATRLEQDITAARIGSTVTDHLAAFMPGAYAIFVRTQLLVHVPPLSEFDPFAERQQRGKRVRSDSDSEAPDIAFIIGKPKHASMVPPAGRGHEFQHGGQTGCRAGCRSVIVEETEEFGSDGFEETALYAS